jgi:hypothetical protein
VLGNTRFISRVERDEQPEKYKQNFDVSSERPLSEG